MILNPYFWLGILIWTAVVGGGCYFKGSKHAQDAARAAHATALEAAITDAKANAQIDAQALIDHERQRQEVKTVFRDKVVTVERMINAKPIPAECRIDDAAVGVLNDAIRAINSKATTQHEPVPANPAPAKREPARVSAGYDSAY
jgi:hypothetical protein